MNIAHAFERPFARVSQVKVGDLVKVDHDLEGFEDKRTPEALVREDERGLFINGRAEKVYLADLRAPYGSDELVGIYIAGEHYGRHQRQNAD